MLEKSASRESNVAPSRMTIPAMSKSMVGTIRPRDSSAVAATEDALAEAAHLGEVRAQLGYFALVRILPEACEGSVGASLEVALDRGRKGLTGPFQPLQHPVRVRVDSDRFRLCHVI